MKRIEKKRICYSYQQRHENFHLLFFLFASFFNRDDEGEELFYKRGTEFKLPYPCLYDFDTNFTSTVTDDDSYSLKNPSSMIKPSSTNLLSSSNSTISSHSSNTASNPRPKKIPKTTIKQQSNNHFQVTPTSTSSSFDPYYNGYPTSYVSSYPSDVTTASFLEAATTNYGNNANNSNELLLVNETNPYSGTYSNYYAAALQQQYQNSLVPYHTAYYQDTSNRYYPSHRSSPTMTENNYQAHHHQPTQQQQQTSAVLNHENYLMDSTANNNPYSYYLYKNPSAANHGHDSNNNLSLFDVSLSTPIHHSVIKHCTKR